jgi:hypothetical protein
METLTAHNCGIDIAYQHFGSSGGQVFQHVQFGYLASLCPATNRLQSRPSPPHTRKVTGSKPAGTTPICAGQRFWWDWPPVATACVRRNPPKVDFPLGDLKIVRRTAPCNASWHSAPDTGGQTAMLRYPARAQVDRRIDRK